MASTEKNSYIYRAEEFGKESFDILFGAPTREDIRVGYIDPDRGYVVGRNICDANRHAKLNPGAQFIIKTRKRVRYMNVNEVNTITPQAAFDATEPGMGIPDEPCKGVQYGEPPGPAQVDLMGGGGVGVKANPVIGRDGSVLAVHIVDGGFGYKYAPLVDVRDPTQIGGGVVAQAFLGEVAAGLETYGDESDLEEYFPADAIDPKTGKTTGVNIRNFCDTQVNVNIEYGRVWGPDGKNVGIWDPTLYSDAEIDPFRRKIEAYQAYLAQLMTPWWVTRRKAEVNTPLSVSSSWDKGFPEYFYEARPGFTKGTTVYPVQHWKWGGYYKKDLEGVNFGSNSSKKELPPLSQGGPETGPGSTNTDIEDVDFNFFVAVGQKEASNGFRWVFRELKEEPFPDKPIYKGEDRYGPHRFVVSPADMKNNRGGSRDFITPKIETLVKKVKVNTTYQVIGEGTTSGYGVEQGLVSKMGFGGHNTEITGVDKKGKMIFIDLIYSENDDDDMQLGATAGTFTQKNRRAGFKGRSGSSFEMYEKDGKRDKNLYNKNTKGTAFTTVKKVLDNNGKWVEKKTEIMDYGRDTYDLFYRVTPEELGKSKRDEKVPEKGGGSGGGGGSSPGLPGDPSGGRGEETAITQSFMNKYAISPIPMSNDRGSDFADQLFTIQWDQLFPHGGKYHFRGQSDNYCAFWLDNEYIADLNSYHGKPWEWKPEFTWEGSDDGEPTVKNIRLELKNAPTLEDIIVQQDDGEWETPDGITDYENVPFDLFVHVAKKFERWENLIEPDTSGELVRVCFDSLGKDGGISRSGGGTTRVDFSIYKTELNKRYGGSFVFADRWERGSPGSSHPQGNVKGGNGADVVPGNSYPVYFQTFSKYTTEGTKLLIYFLPGSLNKDTPNFTKLRLVQEATGNDIVVECTKGQFHSPGREEGVGYEYTGFNGSTFAGGIVWRDDYNDPAKKTTEKFVITPLEAKRSDEVTFDITHPRGAGVQGAAFTLRAPGQDYGFSTSSPGKITKTIPQSHAVEIHVKPGNTSGIGHVSWSNNWRTMKWWAPYVSHNGPADIEVNVSTGRFASQGRGLDTQISGAYNYRYPNFIPTITWAHDDTAAAEGEIVLTETDNKCVQLKTGQNYGIAIYTTKTGTTPYLDIVDGKTTGQKIRYSNSGPDGPFDDLVVTCDKGRFKSFDGTDDWAPTIHSEGHIFNASRPDWTGGWHFLWSMPKESKTRPKPPPNVEGLQFTFESADKSERFTIRSNEIKNDKGDERFGRGLRWSSGTQQVIRRIKVNTKYKVWASVKNPDAGEKSRLCEQGFVKKLGRGDFARHQERWESTLRNGHENKYIFADVVGSDGDGDDLQVGATKGTFIHTNRHRHPARDTGASHGRWTWDLEYILRRKIKDSSGLQGSTQSKIQTKEVFSTTGSQYIKPTSSPKGQMWRINEVGDANTIQGFLNEYGVTPFNPKEVVQESYAGTHKIVWNNVKFPVSAEYNIKVAVDDSVELIFEGPNGINLVRKNGFNNGKSTGSSLFREYFPKGSYKITANLTQSEGGTYSFKPLTQEQKEAARQAEFERRQSKLVEKPVMTSVTFNQGSSAGCTNHSAITGLFKLTRNGSATKDVEIGKQYNVSISSDCGNHRVKIKIANNGRTIKMEDWSDNDYNDLVLTCSGGKFHSINGRFCKYEGGPNVGSADEAQLLAWQANPTISINDIALKGANPMALAVKVSVSYAEAQKIVPHSWYQNPMGVAFTIEAPLPKPPIQKKPIAEGRCPNNPFWTTRFAEDAEKMWYPVRNNKKEKNGEWMWSEFMNKFAMSPLPPLAWSGTDWGGRWFTNEWDVDIPYDGYYRFKMLADDDARFYVKGAQRPEYGNPNLSISRYKGEPAQVKIKLFEGKGKFRVDVKNRDTTQYDHIEKKIFSARDWVGQPGASDAEWEGVADPKRLADVDFDVFASVAREFVLGKEPDTGNKVCFNSVGKDGGGPGSGASKCIWRKFGSIIIASGSRTPYSGYFRMSTDFTFQLGGRSYGEYEQTIQASWGPQSCWFGGMYYPGFIAITDGGKEVSWCRSRLGLQNYIDGVKNAGTGGTINDPDRSGPYRVVSNMVLRITCTTGKFFAAGKKENTVYYYDLKQIGREVVRGDPDSEGVTRESKIWLKWNPSNVPLTHTERFVITPLNGSTGNEVTFSVTKPTGVRQLRGSFRLRAPGQPFDFSRNSVGSTTKSIPRESNTPGQVRTDEVHIVGARGLLVFRDNWTRMSYRVNPDSSGGVGNDGMDIVCSTGRFRSPGRQLNKDYVYQYPHFIPTITWEHDGLGRGGVIELTETDNWCGELESGVDYGIAIYTNRGGTTPYIDIVDGQTTGQKIRYSTSGQGGPFDDLIVTCDKGRFRSFDGTDDWAPTIHSEGHIFNSSRPAWTGGWHFLWSMPKATPSPADNWNPDVNGLRFTFSAKDGSHRFEIKPQEVKRGDVDGLGSRYWSSAGIQKVTKKVKLNTIYNVSASINALTGKELLDRCEQGFVPKLGRGVFAQEQQKWEDTIPNGGSNKYIFAEVIPSQPWEDSLTPSGGDGDDLQIGATQGTFKHWNKRRHKDAPYTWQKGLGYWTYDLTYEIPWDPPPVVAENVTKTGTIRDGVTYTGPYLMHYVERDWSPYMNKMNVAPIIREDLNLALYEDDILGTKKMVWEGVRFDHPGDYDIRFMADNIGRFYLNGEKLLDATNNYGSDKQSSHSKVSIASSGPHTIRVELDNSDGSNVFYDNPTGMVLEITKPLKLVRYGPDGRPMSDSWVQNPVAVSMECIPPPCAKVREGKGVVENIIVIDPGNGFVAPPAGPENPAYPVVNQITGFHVVDPGINYSEEDVLAVDVPGLDPVEFQIIPGPFGTVATPPTIRDPGDPVPPDEKPLLPPVTEYPDLTVRPPLGSPRPPTGVNANIVPIITPRVILPDGIDPLTGLPIPPDQIIQVTDLAGIKRTGFYNGKPYYGAVFYKDGVRYAGYYETAGVLIQIYDTLQESIDATVTTPPSAILRQGTDISSNDPRLDIPGTPQ